MRAESIVRGFDAALDRLVVPGYGRTGLALRRRLPGWPGETPRMDGKVVLVTGAGGGIGRAAAIGFAELGARVHVLARSPERAGEAAQAVRAALRGATGATAAEIIPESCDVSSLAAAREFTQRFVAEQAQLHVLVNNAGMMPPARSHTAEGHETMFATHVLVPFALTEWLSGVLEAGRPSSVINVSSGGMYAQPLDGSDPESERVDYKPATIYARTKRAEVVISEMWAEELAARGIAVDVMHPGWVDTEGVRDALPGFRTLTRPLLRAPREGADTIVWLGATRGRHPGGPGIWHDRVRRPSTHPLGAGAPDPADRRRLWDYCRNAVAAYGSK